MGSPVEIVFLLLLNIVVNIIIGKFFQCKEHEARDAPCRGWSTFWPLPGPAAAMMPFTHQLSDLMLG